MHRRHFLAAAPLALVLAPSARAEDVSICIHDGLAIGGADPVAYFTDNAFVTGDARHAVMWRGAIWHFARPDTMAVFEMDPTLYSPQFGGFCANAMSHGVLSPSEGRSWLIHDGALYLCSSPLALRRFARSIDASIAAARANWPALQDG
jgi:hypothetical protein